MKQNRSEKRPQGGIPRGLAKEGPVLFSYGFRPFFLGAAIWAVLAMTLWLAVLFGHFQIASGYGTASWHVHEMLFGFGPAVLTGYLMTSVPNWSGRLPVSGPPLMLVFAVWCAGRLALAASTFTGSSTAIVIDALFLPLIGLLCAREIVLGRKWKDLKLVAILIALTAANIAFHASVLSSTDTGIPVRLSIALYILLITTVGGRMIPSFTRTQFKLGGITAIPAPFGVIDRLAIALTLSALTGWIAIPETRLTAALAISAALAQMVRLFRWHGWRLSREPLLLSLHIAYGFVALGLSAIALTAVGTLSQPDAIHVLTVGAIGGMMMTVMMRSTRGHTGKAIAGSRLTMLACLSLFSSAILRPLAGLAPDFTGQLYAAAGTGWIIAFSLFIAEYRPMLAFVRRTPR